MSFAYVFDLDGTLVDSRDAVQAAYEEVGVQMPEHAWGLPWRMWLPELCGGSVPRAMEVHLLKNQVYLQHPERLRELPLAALARVIQGRLGLHIAVHTGASLIAAEFVLATLNIATQSQQPYGAALRAQLNLNEKIGALSAISVTHERGIYFDDCQATCDAVGRHVSQLGIDWKVCHVI